MRITQVSDVGPGHPDYPVLSALEAELIERGGGISRIQREIPQLIRRAIDEVIDAPRTGRLTLSQIEKTEKTYIGTKIEIVIRQFFGLPKGLLDLEINGQDVDIKNTIGSNWMIPKEAVSKPCILIAADETEAICQFGLLVCRLEYLTKGQNRDAKRSVVRDKFSNIRWLLINQPYPKNFWEGVDPNVTKRIMLGRSGNSRIVQLFRELQRVPIHRDIIQAVAQQRDYMKRLRRNGGARDQLAQERIAVLSGHYDAHLIASFQLGAIGPDEFIAVKANTPADEALLRATGHID